MKALEFFGTILPTCLVFFTWILWIFVEPCNSFDRNQKQWSQKNRKILEKMIAYDRKSGNSLQSERIFDKNDDLNQKNRKNLEKFGWNRFESTKNRFRDNMHRLYIVTQYSVDMHECHEKIVCSHCTRMPANEYFRFHWWYRAM